MSGESSANVEPRPLGLEPQATGGLLSVLKERWILVCGLYYVALCSTFAFTRVVIGDESQLLLVGQAVYSGQRLYRDVWFNQMPLAPFVYGAIQELWGPSLYLGRFTSVVLSLGTFLLTVRAGRLMAGGWGARIAATLFAFNWVLASHYAGSYSPAMTGLLLTAAGYSLLKGDSLGCRLAALICADLAVCTRALVFPFTVAVNWYVLWRRREARWTVAAVAGLPPFLFYAAFILGQEEHFLFANLYWNKGVTAFPVDTEAALGQAVAALPGLGTILLRKAADMGLRANSFILMFEYFPLAVLSVPLGLAWYRSRVRGERALPDDTSRRGAVVALTLGLAGFVGMTFIFSGLIVPTGVPNYQTPGYPLFILLCVYAYQAIVVAETRFREELRQLIIVVVAIAALAYGLPNVAYASGVRNIPGRGLTLPLNGIREVALFLRDRSGPADEILTDRPWFAFEAGRAPHLGFWMTWFSYAPDWSTEMARRYHLVNGEMIRQSLEARAPKFIIRYVDEENESDPITFAMRHSPDPEAVQCSFEEGYERIASFPGVGKRGEGVVVYQRRQGAAAGRNRL